MQTKLKQGYVEKKWIEKISFPIVIPKYWWRKLKKGNPSLLVENNLKWDLEKEQS